MKNSDPTIQKDNRYKLLRTLFLWVFFFMNTPWSEAQKIDWLTFEEAIEMNKKVPKKILIDVYTDWCGYCKKMERLTYNNKTIATLLNTYFYPVKFNAEQRETLTYNHKNYDFIKQGRRGVHAFAIELLNGKMSYPSTVFLDSNASLLDRVPGYLSPPLMEKVLTYLGKEKFKTQDWSHFEKSFQGTLK